MANLVKVPLGQFTGSHSVPSREAAGVAASWYCRAPDLSSANSVLIHACAV